jgi:hypothetical protein
MPKEIYPSSYECDCGHRSEFSERTIREIKQMSLRKPVRLSDAGKEPHVILFRGGRMVYVLCPKDTGERTDSGESRRDSSDQSKAGRGAARRKRPAPYTQTQGQYLAFIHLYTKLHRRPPAEADIQMYFRVSPPSVHQMILTLERRGLIERTPGMPRSIRIILPAEELPELLPNLGSRS